MDVCEECGAETIAGAAVCGRCGATGPGSFADRMTPSPFGPPVARMRISDFGALALAGAHDALQAQTRARVPVWREER